MKKINSFKPFLSLTSYHTVSKGKGGIQMGIQTVFERTEKKYIINAKQRRQLLEKIEEYIKPDEYGESTICSLYFDTDDYRLIRNSIEKPVYKEKLRLRSYSTPKQDSKVFLELKKKYKGIVYKRRISLPLCVATDWICTKNSHPHNSQIVKEIDYFMQYYETLHPTVFLSYEREAYYSIDGSDFRVTFDENILCRQTDLSLETNAYGTPILDSGLSLMEIKCSGGIPLWMAHLLSEEHIYKTSYSKYGTAYQTLIFPNIKGDFTNGNII